MAYAMSREQRAAPPLPPSPLLQRPVTFDGEDVLEGISRKYKTK